MGFAKAMSAQCWSIGMEPKRVAWLDRALSLLGDVDAVVRDSFGVSVVGQRCG